MNNTIPVITIDGFSGCGKGTISQLLAQHLSWHLLDSGALYRVLALIAKQREVDLTDEKALSKLAAHLDVEFIAVADEPLVGVILDGQDVSIAVRTEEIGNVASKIAAFPDVRKALLQRQRDFRQAPGLIADGRDMGTVVFSDAEFKFFLTATCEERAKRRYKQLLEKGINVKLAQLFEELAARDARDEQRVVSPLKPARDAVIIDTTELTIEQVIQRILVRIHERYLA